MRSVRELVLVGSGGFARETAEAVRAVNAVHETWALRGYLDDDASRHGQEISGLPVIGPVEMVDDLPEAAVVLTTGRPDNYTSRRSIADRLGLDEERYATIIHPLASVGDSCRVGPGSVLLAHSALTADIVVGRHVAVMPQVVIPHDTTVEDFATLASGVLVGGGCHLGEGAYLGSGTCLRQGVEIGPWAMVGMGSVVTRNVPAERLWMGVPARDSDRAPLPFTQPAESSSP